MKKLNKTVVLISNKQKTILNNVKIVLSLFSLSILCLCLAGCSKHIPSEKISSNVSSFELAKKFEIGEKEFEDGLTKVVDKKVYELIPIENTNEDKKFWLDMMVRADEEYMSNYFSNRHNKKPEEAEKNFSDNLYNMWMVKKPEILTFKVSLNGEDAGMIQISFLTTSENPYFSYVTLEKFKGQGVATNALRLSIDLLKKLKSNNYYKITELSLTIFPENIASQIVAEKNGFKRVESEGLDSLGRYRYSQKI